MSAQPFRPIVQLPMGDLWSPYEMVANTEKDEDGNLLPDVIKPRKDNIDISRLPQTMAPRGSDVAAILKQQLEEEVARLHYEAQLAAASEKPAK